jgi:hypothetical protein
MRNLLPISLLGLALSACIGLDGNGHRVDERRDLADFSRIENNGPFDLEVKQGDDFDVRVSIDSNLLHRVDTHVHGDTLAIDSDAIIGDVVAGPHVIVTLPALDELVLHGSGDATVDAFDAADPIALRITGSGDLRFSGSAPRFTLEVNGSGDLRVTGDTDFAKVKLTGSGNVEARDLAANGADIELDGSGDARLTVNGPVDADLNGSGDIDLYGEVDRGHFSEDGSGDITVH